MLKTIATFAALATLAATTIAPAHAIRSSQGMSLNGVGENGIGVNGGGNNGFTTNGFANNGGGNNGVEDSSSALSIQAIELPPETR
ncbi:MAG: hypothetical protein EPO55_14995 [Reyranella sp.]|uniref:hypothetical protein n=1 Tax=Reyranella sp. TaxID=1929291 RepID=UPI0012199BD6|nr:hypothetical protein [Reyranella sp.]TAJ38664.1 MAG: hypothetical protein EPO55_14995 [Reyranella sp.]